MKKVIDQKRLNTIASIAKFVVGFLILLPLSRAELYGLRPFGTAFYIALVFFNLPLLVITPFYFTAEMLAGGIYAFFASMVVSLIAILLKMLSTRFERKYFLLFSILVSIISSCGIAIFSEPLGYNIFHIIVNTVCVALFLQACIYVLTPLLQEKLRYKMLETEVICLGIVVVIISLGLSYYDIAGVPIVMIIACYSIFVSAYMALTAKAVLVGICFGIGNSLFHIDINYLAIYVFISLIASIFVLAPKPIMPIASIMGYVMATFFFFADYTSVISTIIALAVGGVLYIVTPTRILKAFKNYMFLSSERVAVRYMINKHRQDLGSELYSTSNIFFELGKYIGVDKAEGIDYTDTLKNRCCAFCDNYDNCKSAEHSHALEILTRIVVTNGAVAVNNIPKFIYNDCKYLAKIMGVANQLGESHKKVMQKIEADKNARDIVSSAMDGVASVLSDKAKSNSAMINCDDEREKLLSSELNYLGVVSAQCLISGNEICLIVRTETFDRAIIEKAVHRIMKVKYRIDGIDDTILSGFCAINLKLVPKYDVVFGVSSTVKSDSEKSGDTHSFIKIDNSRFMLALCDGMGSGEKAGILSETAISLVENFYRAGFDHSLVLSSVNRFLSLNGGEGFSAIDICVIDLNTARADIIKLASPPSYIKHKDTISRIDGQSVPIGVMDTIEPTIVTVPLELGDMITLVSDGVSDSFSGDKLASAINNLKTTAPQTIAQSVLDHAIFLNKGVAKDDSTVVVARVIAPS